MYGYSIVLFSSLLIYSYPKCFLFLLPLLILAFTLILCYLLFHSYKMLKVGLPMGAVTNAMQRDGKDSAVMEFDQNRPLQIQLDEKNKYQDYQLSDWM